MSWIIKEEGFYKEKIEFFGSKFSIGNGYLGYRGTLEEYSKKELVACTLAALFDDSGNGWREPVNAPNGLLTRVYSNNQLLSVLNTPVEEHAQSLDIKSALHTRKSTFTTNEGTRITLVSERFASIEDLHLISMRYTIKADKDADIVIETGIDGAIWDINGPHLEKMECSEKSNIIYINTKTCQIRCDLSIVEAIKYLCGEQEILKTENSVIRRVSLKVKAGIDFTFEKYVSIYKGTDDTENTLGSAIEACIKAQNLGYNQLFSIHCGLWNKRWESSDIKIDGDDEAQLALRYSIYLLLISSPFHTDKVAIPARGLSGQVYKGAMFWDTEMYMLPMFNYTVPEVARNLVMYRVNTLEGARKKAAEYGFRGAFYAWESQENGDDGCTHFNLNDVFTGRPMRTYFRDKQIHISAAVAYGIWMYYSISGEVSVLLDGGAEVILECARFFFSYSYFKKEKNRYELLDVTGADEYHERVNNNSYTNAMVKLTLEGALEILELLKEEYPAKYNELINKLNYEEDINNIKEMNALLYIPEPSISNQVIEQYDGYFKQEDLSLKELKSRIIIPNEYLGSPCGLAVNTQILKQADVVLQLSIFKDRYSQEIKKANWKYYEPRTEHGSSLSTCVYALLAADIGELEWAYKFFMKAATIDLLGNYKLYLGNLYIGGTHPAANGGSWMVAVLGFGGLNAGDEQIELNPRLPENWKRMSFNFYWKKQKFIVEITPTQIEIIPDSSNNIECLFNIYGKGNICKPGKKLNVKYA